MFVERVVSKYTHFFARRNYNFNQLKLVKKKKKRGKFASKRFQFVRNMRFTSKNNNYPPPYNMYESIWQIDKRQQIFLNNWYNGKKGLRIITSL